MDRNRVRGIAAGVALVLAVMIAVPGFSATSPGSITLRVPDSFQKDTVSVAWTYKAGTVVKSSSLIDVLASSDSAHWQTVASKVAIGKLGYLWTVTNWSDAVYAVKLRLSGTNTYSAVDYAYVDHSKPTVEITRPSKGEVLVDDTAIAAVDAVVAGRTTLKAAASDALSGVQSLVWQVDGVEVAQGLTAIFDFSSVIGVRTLTAVATDGAGNSETASMTVLALPGQSVAAAPSDLPTPEPTDISTPDPNNLPSPDPSIIPTLPTIPSPDPSSVPSPDPSVGVPSPDPSIIPTLPPIPPTP